MNITQRQDLFRKILKKYNYRDFLNNQDFETIISLFKNHPSWNIKQGNGIEKIEIIKDKWSKKAYLIHRKDKTTTDISFIIASRGYSGNDISRIKSACRNAIVPIILEERKKIKWGFQKCPITNELLINHETHIDHYDLTFEYLFNKWIKQFEDVQQLIQYLNNNQSDNVVEDFFTNQEIKNNFIEFHNLNTHLRAVSKKANLSYLRRKNNEMC